MKIETLDLHGLNQSEAKAKIDQNLAWIIRHGIDVLVISHGKGHHSSTNFAVLKAETRKLLKANRDLEEAGYLVVYGEADLPIALRYDEGNTLVVARGREQEYMGGSIQQEKDRRIFSEDGRRERKNSKRMRK
ncbi:MAG TPA: Smr/MutS family protein [Syntrophomonas sp.]|nr:Smr/MutS family protein [Syntrophomonas sp.]HRW13129.1 Smr/MutS family protein [Syntrophomonas sp.]